MKIIPDSRIRNIISKSLKYRFPSQIDFNRCREEIASDLNDLVIDVVKESVLSAMLLKNGNYFFNIMDKRIKFFFSKHKLFLQNKDCQY